MLRNSRGSSSKDHLFHVPETDISSLSATSFSMTPFNQFTPGKDTKYRRSISASISGKVKKIEAQAKKSFSY